MLANSFVFLPRVGERTEAALWRRGVHTWDDYRAEPPFRGVPSHVKSDHDRLLAVAEGALGKDPSFFARRLADSEHWRAFGEFADRAAYVDIETTGGIGGNSITVVGIHLAGETRLLVRRRDLTPEAVSGALADASMLVTFNGAGFDLPFLAAYGAELPRVPHLDLRHALGRVGYKGGLKKIEKTLGVARGDAIDGLSGWDAVRLWHAHELGDDGALATLLEYNRADVENMVPLARRAYDLLVAATFGANRGARLRVVPLET
ncbi:MAG: ribonuclease H-like domain-containing protein [Thermoplasmatota archaeon]